MIQSFAFDKLIKMFQRQLPSGTFTHTLEIPFPGVAAISLWEKGLTQPGQEFFKPREGIRHKAPGPQPVRRIASGCLAIS